MKLEVLTISHRTADSVFRGQLSLTDEAIYRYAEKVINAGCTEIVVLSTCSRMEVYAISDVLESPAACACLHLERLFSTSLKDKALIYTGRKAVGHIFRVAAGLDSIILFEDQILGQVKQAYHNAIEQRISGKYLNKLFREAITCAKQIKTKGMKNAEERSLAHAGIDYLGTKSGGVAGTSILFIGLGKMGRMALDYALEFPFREIYVTNRSMHRDYGEDFRDKRIVPLDFCDRYDVMEKNDIRFLVSATASPHTIISADKLKCGRIAILDLAMPGDVEPGVGEMDGVSLYTMDSLGAASEKFRDGLEGQIGYAAGKAAEGTVKYLNWLCAEENRKKQFGCFAPVGQGRES